MQGCIAPRSIDDGSYYSNCAQQLKRHFLEKYLGHFDGMAKDQAAALEARV